MFTIDVRTIPPKINGCPQSGYIVVYQRSVAVKEVVSGKVPSVLVARPLPLFGEGLFVFFNPIYG